MPPPGEGGEGWDNSAEGDQEGGVVVAERRRGRWKGGLSKAFLAAASTRVNQRDEPTVLHLFFRGAEVPTFQTPCRH